MTTKELFFKLLRYKSITPNDDGAFLFIKEYLNDFTCKEINVEDTKNLFLYKKFGDGKHLCFAGHIDVVPPGNGWDTNPFEPVIKDDKVYARGTQDMKSGVCAFLKACHDTKNFSGTLSIILTSDEEGDAKHGTIEVLNYLKKENFLPDFAIVAEPTCEKVFGDAIKIGRRGSINGVLKIFGSQGHAAYPEKSINPVHKFASILPKMAGHFFDNGDENFAPSQLVITDIRGGMEVTNVTPGELKIMFNVRNSTNTTKEDIKSYIEELCKDLDFELVLTQGSFPFVTNNDSKVVKVLKEAIKEELHVDTKFSTAGGTSDARMLAPLGIEVVEFGVINDTIHAPNERCGLSEVEGLEKVFKNVIKKF
jgi:succinyl-diaminopimelate desuccinylase